MGFGDNPDNDSLDDNHGLDALNNREWQSATGQYSRQDARGGIDGYKAISGGAAVGIDTGNTLAKILPVFYEQNPASLKVASLLFKPDALKHDFKIDYVGMEIPNEFIVGYGLDYDGLGRNLRDIYQVTEE